MKHLVPWLTLKSVPAIGNLLFTRLLCHFGSPERVLSAPTQALAQVEGITPRLAQAIQRHRTPDWIFKQIDQATEKGYAIITCLNEAYPALLKQIPDPPPVLFVYGRLEKPFCPIAVVGSRKATNYGLTTTHRLGAQLAERGATVVSGMARGIDTAAHQGALENGGRTLAVLGCGLDVVYPPENKKLYQQIPQQGALISEFPLGTPPEGRNFPVRNRLISGLSWAVVVVEAGAQSGTHITVQYALDQGREVLAVPGPVNSPNSVGPHRLIQQGAKLVHEVGDILQELPRDSGVRPTTRPGAVTEPPARPRPDDPLLPLLGADPVQLEELVQASHLPAAEVLSRLTMLELQGLIKELPGKCFVLDG